MTKIYTVTESNAAGDTDSICLPWIYSYSTKEKAMAAVLEYSRDLVQEDIDEYGESTMEVDDCDKLQWTNPASGLWQLYFEFEEITFSVVETTLV